MPRCCTIELTCKMGYIFFFFKQNTAYEIRPRDWSSDVCSSDLHVPLADAEERIATGGRKRVLQRGATSRTRAERLPTALKLLAECVRGRPGPVAELQVGKKARPPRGMECVAVEVAGAEVVILRQEGNDGDAISQSCHHDHPAEQRVRIGGPHDAAPDDGVFPSLWRHAAHENRLVEGILRPGRESLKHLHERLLRVGEQVAAGVRHGPQADRAALAVLERR